MTDRNSKNHLPGSQKPRARDLGWVPPAKLPPGPTNAITDVRGVLVGHRTLIRGQPGPLVVGIGPVRTGVTAIRPHLENIFTHPVAAGVHILNGFGKSTGLDQLRETGRIETPILLTNTLNVWRAADALVDWMLRDNPGIGIDTRGTVNPIVGECHDGVLSDIQGRHVEAEDVWLALDEASDRVIEGCIGGGTGTRSFGFKAGIGTASRRLPEVCGGFTLGVLVQANFGLRRQLTIRGMPIGEHLHDWPQGRLSQGIEEAEQGSCMIVIATDAPLSSRQLTRVANRAPLGLARLGSVSGPGSGDYAIAFSTQTHSVQQSQAVTRRVERPVDEWKLLGCLAQGVVEATEEAVLNSLAAAETMSGRDHSIAHALPPDLVKPFLG